MLLETCNMESVFLRYELRHLVIFYRHFSGTQYLHIEGSVGPGRGPQDR
jgi:hypothetical protein